MTCTSNTGGATAAGCLAYAKYVIKSALETENQAAAEYYAAGVKERDRPEPSLMLRSDLSAEFAARLGIDRSRHLNLTEFTHLLNKQRADGKPIEGAKKHSAHQSVAEIFGLPAKGLPTVEQIENVLAGRRADATTADQHLAAWLAGTAAPDLDKLSDIVSRGEAGVSGEAITRKLTADLDRAIQAAELREAGTPPLTREARALHGLPDEPPPVPQYLDGVPSAALRERREAVLEQWERVSAEADYRADLRAEGREPEAVEPKLSARIESAVRQFKSAMGVHGDRDATPEEIQRVADGRINVADYYKHINATAPPTGFVDLTFSVDKSVTAAWVNAPTDTERAIIMDCIQSATDDAMAYVQNVLGVARRGAGGKEREDPAEMVWVGIRHYNSRPAIDIVRTDAAGRDYTDTRAVPGGTADPNLHQHRLCLNSVMTKDGHIGSLDLVRLKGEQKIFGAVFHASLATKLREHGVDVGLGPHGEARIAGIPDWYRKFLSRRSTQGEQTAREFAKAEGKNWDGLSAEEKAALIDAGCAKSRQPKLSPDGTLEARRKSDEPPTELSVWQQEAVDAGYRHRSVLRPDAERKPLTREERIEVARNTALALLDKEFQTSSVLTGAKVREIAARGLIVSGIGKDAAADIEAVTKTFRERGVLINGKHAELIISAEESKHGRRQTYVTTDRALETEEGVIQAVRTAAADKSTAMSAAQIDNAAERFLAAHPKIDPNGEQWKAQLKMAHAIGEGPRMSLNIGVAGSGKTLSVIGTMNEAWHADGRTVYGMTVPWKATSALRDAGVDVPVSAEAFLKRVESGKYKIDGKSVIVVDETSQVGLKHQAALLKLAAQTGAQLVEVGDPKQTQAVQAPAFELMAKAIGDENISKLLTTVRQATERDRKVATLFRDGQAADGIAALQEDGRFHLVVGGRDATIRRTVVLWRTLADANGIDATLVMTPTNKQALEVGAAIRENRRKAGEIGRTDTVLQATDPNSKETYDLPVAVGDRLRMFTRTFDADTPGRTKCLSSNGDVVEVREVLPDGLRIRNAKGDEGRITMASMKPFRAPRNDPVQVTYGYAVTPDSAQSLTRTATIFAAPDGSNQVSGFKAYTAMSRFVDEGHLVMSDAAERKDIVKRQMLGLADRPSPADVMRNIENNLSRFDEKLTATDVIRRAIAVQRCSTGSRHGAEIGSASHEAERSASQQDISRYQRSRMAEMAQRIPQYVMEAAHHVHQAAQDLWALRRQQAQELPQRYEQQQRRSQGMQM